MMASPVFKAMLKHCFMEGLTLRATGKVEVPLPDDDPVAFALLMDIVHGTKARAPPQMDTLFLTTLAILVDKYRLQQYVVTSSDMWVDSLRDEIPKTLTPDLLHWLCMVVWSKVSVFINESEYIRTISRHDLNQLKSSMSKNGVP